MKVLSVIGYSASGKTTIVETIIREVLRRQYSVASVKDIHFEDFQMDTPGTNSYRHREAGAEQVAARGLEETAILYPRQLNLTQLLQHFSQDYVIMEGVRDANVPEIVSARNEEDLEELCNSRTLAIAGKIANDPHKTIYKGIPIINVLHQGPALVDLICDRVPPLLPDFPPECCRGCGYTCRQLLEEILAGRARYHQCLLLNQDVKVSLGDRQLPMVPFVQEALSGIIRGYLATLDGYEKHEPITIHLPGPKE